MAGLLAALYDNQEGANRVSKDGGRRFNAYSARIMKLRENVV